MIWCNRAFSYPMARFIRAFTSKLLKTLAFSNSKNHFIYFNNSLYNTSNIKGSIFTFIPLKQYKQLIKIK